MLAHVRRSIQVACAVAACALPLAGNAQTTLDLGYGASTPCTYVTDASGIHLDPETGHLVANGTFGSGCPSGSVSDPNFTNGLAGDVAASVAVGASFTLTWAAANSTECDYTGSSHPAGSTIDWPTSGAACTSTSDCANAHSAPVTADVAGTYNFKLTCHNGSNPTVATSSVSTTASAGGPGGACTTGPAGLSQIMTANVTYVGAGFSVAPNVDVTQYQNIWGRYSPGGTILPWPERDNVLVYLTLSRNQYLSAKFTVPDPYTNTHQMGRMARGDVAGDVSGTSASISEVCGDFTNVPPACVINHGLRGSPLIQWSINGSIPGTCPLVPGHTYYMNIMMSPLANPDAAHSWCNGSGCIMSTVPYFVN
jgi:hypothetical protein